ncbi:MAG TPA: DNA-formamidopyrimidine glycosylase family protein, partial [Gemmatimonadaceae bacterium]|nr:DNA-formamidopyrimidine glycosylase family protein [Gemmatimonadaceae bacterium]
MPELPDIAAYLEALTSRISGEPIEQLEVVKPFVLRTVVPRPDAFAGARVCAIRRIGKRVALGAIPADASPKPGDAGEHDSVEARLWVVMHLMIAGRLRWRPPGPKVPRSLILARLHFSSGVLHFTEAGSKRRASVHLVRGDEALAQFDRGGLEVLGATADEFAMRLRSENHTLKRALTDPRLFSGIGNAYSDEILHAARLSPLVLTSRLSDEDAERLHEAAVATLRSWSDRLREEAVRAFPEKVTAFREGMAVHGRYGKPCPVCFAPVQRIRYADNETNYCARCQNEGRLYADRGLSRLLK